MICISYAIQQQVKGISKEELETRNDLVLALPERIQEIPDGTETAGTKAGIWASSASHKNIKFDSSGNQCFLCFSRVTYFNESQPFDQLFMLACFLTTQMEILRVNFSSKMKSQVNSGRSMKCGRRDRHITTPD